MDRYQYETATPYDDKAAAHQAAVEHELQAVWNKIAAGDTAAIKSVIDAMPCERHDKMLATALRLAAQPDDALNAMALKAWIQAAVAQTIMDGIEEAAKDAAFEARTYPEWEAA